MSTPHVYLASHSPRRRELLDQIGVKFDVLGVDIDETQLAEEIPSEYVQRLAITKASSGKKLLQASSLNDNKNKLTNWQSTKKHATIDLVLGADTAVVSDGDILGKPESPEHASEMLRQLSGRTHEVFTGVAIAGSRILTAVSRNLVTFRALSEQEISCYVATNEGCDKAGSYAVQGIAAIFIEKIQGSYSGVMGLPLYEVANLLSQSGVEILAGVKTTSRDNN